MTPAPPPSDDPTSSAQAEAERRRLGVWLIGARGAISTCVAYGLAGLRQGLLEPVGLITCRAPLERLDLRPLEDLVLGGHEIAAGDLSRSASELVKNRVLERELVASAAGEVAQFDARIRPGILDTPDLGRADLDAGSLAHEGSGQRERVQALRADLEAFQRDNDLERVVVVNVASTEAWREPHEAWESLASFEAALDEGPDLPASSLYAYAALDAGMPFVNFTPNRGVSLPALRELALARGLPLAGDDGKTGETLLKTTLAPMFAARALKVLAWQGYNMLGNGDGASLADPIRREAKCRNKDEALRALLGDDDTHTAVGIDYVPSLHDWKTAWDFVHFEGFLGTSMSFQFTWSGSDSALAAPLVLDLVRLVDEAARHGLSGPLDHTACFFKSPLAGGTHDFHRQFARLLAYAEARVT